MGWIQSIASVRLIGAQRDSILLTFKVLIQKYNFYDSLYMFIINNLSCTTYFKKGFQKRVKAYFSDTNYF